MEYLSDIALSLLRRNYKIIVGVSSLRKVKFRNDKNPRSTLVPNLQEDRCYSQILSGYDYKHLFQAHYTRYQLIFNPLETINLKTIHS